MRRTHVIAGLCVLLGIGVIGFVLSGIGRIQEANSRVRCASQLKGLGYAIHHYADANQDRFPPGTVPLPGTPTDRRLSWVVLAGPYYGNGRAEIERFVTAGPADEKQNVTAAEARFLHLVCPSSGAYEERGGWAYWKSPTPLTHYVGVSGVGTDAAELPERHPRAGAFGYDRTASRTDGFPDGLANTLLLVETADEPGHWAFGGPGTVRSFVPAAAPYIGEGRPFGGFHPAEYGWLGKKGGAMNVVMADTSIRTIRGDIDPAVLEALATVSGREPLPAEW